MKFLSLPTALLIVILTAVPPVFAQSATLTATVSVNPLEVEIASPSDVLVRKRFDIEVQITNNGAGTVTNTIAKIDTPARMSVKKKKQQVGTIGPGETTKAVWQAKANQPGNYVILVEVSGDLGDEEVSTTDSEIVSASDSIILIFLKRLFGG